MYLQYSNIQHVFRKNNALDLKEYILCDMVYFLSGDKSPAPGWCVMGKKELAGELEISERSVFSMIEKMITAGFLIRHSTQKFLKSTVKWQAVYFADSGVFAVPLQNLQAEQAKFADEPPAKFAVHYNINNTDNKTDNINTVGENKFSPDPAPAALKVEKTNTDILPAPPAPEITPEEQAERTLFKNFEIWILQNAPAVSKMREPFTFDQYREIKKAGYNSEKIRDLLKAMHNWTDLTKKRRSAYLTLLNWHKRDEQ
jgi:hypothetical protein